MECAEAGAPRRLRLVELPPLADGFGARLAQALSRRVSLPVQVERAPQLAFERTCLPGRGQWNATQVLAQLEDWPCAQHELRLGVTAHDVAVPVFSYVFGLARAAGGAALVSLARLDQAFYGLPSDPERTLARALGEALHELGHLAGLPHCDGQCLMRFAGTLDKAEARGLDFCPACAGRLPRWLRVNAPGEPIGPPAV